MKRLENATIIENVEEISKVGEELQDIIYGQYKNAYMLSLSNNYRGASATACKNYITKVTINIINGFLNVIQEMTDTLSEVKTTFLGYESEEDGIVNTGTLFSVDDEITGNYKNAFTSLVSEVDGVLQEAAKYISVTKISQDVVTDAYSSWEDKVTKINDDLLAADTTAKDKLDVLLGHMKSLESMIDGVGQIIDTEKHIDYEKVSDLVVSGSYYQEDDSNLEKIKKDDPFSYYANGGSGWEQQWAQGFYQDVYAYAGVSAWTGEYASKYNNGKYSGNASSSFFQGDVGGQFTDYAKFNGTASAVHGEGKVNAGFSDKYVGASASGKASLLNANGKVTLGTENFNGYITGDATLFGASGYAKCEFEDNGSFAVGLGGNVTGASAKAALGLSFLGVSAKDSVTGKKESLFGASITPEATYGTGADFLVEGKKVIDTDSIDVHTVHVKLGGKLGLGITADVTMPYFTFD